QSILKQNDAQARWVKTENIHITLRFLGDRDPQQIREIIKALSPLEYQCLCKGIFKKRNSRQASPAIEQEAIVEIEIAEDACVGPRQIRLISPGELSNPLRFMVGEHKEIKEEYFEYEKKKTASSIVSFPIIANGEIMPGEVDRIAFDAKKGEEFRFTLEARSLIPYLGDAVPGWFQPIISVHDEKGSVLVYADDEFHHPDPVLEFHAPVDGKFEIRIRDSIFRGREDFVYRLQAEKSPKPKEKDFKKMADFIDIEKLPKVASEQFNYRKAKFSESDMTMAQELKIPVLVEGCIYSPSAKDCYQVELEKGADIVFETIARRLDSPIDSLIQVFDSKGNMLAWNDDMKLPNVGILTQHADSHLIFSPKESGKYFIRISDTQSKGGPQFKYLLRIDRPKLDFRVYTTSSSLNSHSGLAIPIILKVFRFDSFNGEIQIKVSEGPEGMKIDGGTIPAGRDEMAITVSIPADTDLGIHPFKLSAVANFAGETVEREIIPCDEQMQAFIYTHLLPADEALLNVAGGGRRKISAKGIPETISISPGETKEISFSLPVIKKNEIKYSFELFSPPPGLSLGESKLEGEKWTIFIHADPKAVKWKGNIILQLYAKGEGRGKRSLASLPAIPSQIK
nr:2'-5' RNA ligase family protein [Victivallales bacterium]